jgi:hypothetical protein
LSVVAVGIADSSRNLYSMVGEKLLDILNQGSIGKHTASVGFNIDLVYMNLTGDLGPGTLQPIPVFHLEHDPYRNVNHRLEALLRGFSEGRRQCQPRHQNGKQSSRYD